MRKKYLVALCIVATSCGWSESEGYLKEAADQNPDSALVFDSDSSSEFDSDLDGSVDETCNDGDTSGTCGESDTDSAHPFDTDSISDWDGGTGDFDAFCGDPRFIAFTREGGRPFPVEDIPFKGEDVDPEVVIHGFSNFYCSHCRSASILLRTIFSSPVYANRTAYYFHHFGWSEDMTISSWDAHRAAYAADRQGFFWQMHDAIFDAATAPYQNDLYSIAVDLGLDTKQFAIDYTSLEAEEYLKRDLMDGRDAGVGGTPTLFVNGFHLSPWSDLQELLNCLYGI